MMVQQREDKVMSYEQQLSIPFFCHSTLSKYYVENTDYFLKTIQTLHKYVSVSEKVVLWVFDNMGFSYVS